MSRLTATPLVMVSMELYREEVKPSQRTPLLAWTSSRASLRRTLARYVEGIVPQALMNWPAKTAGSEVGKARHTPRPPQERSRPPTMARVRPKRLHRGLQRKTPMPMGRLPMA